MAARLRIGPPVDIKSDTIGTGMANKALLERLGFHFWNVNSRFRLDCRAPGDVKIELREIMYGIAFEAQGSQPRRRRPR